MMKGAFFAAALCATVSVATAAELNDYRRGIELDVKEKKPLVELDVPDLVYRTMLRADLGDVRVFNAEGQPVPHTLCAARVWSEASIETQSLPVFELSAGAKLATNGARIEVQTPAGSRVHIDDSAPKKAQSGKVVRAHVIDAHEVKRDIRAIAVHWQSPDGASEVKVRVEASNDLDAWRDIVGVSTLLELKNEAGELQRQRIPLPQGTYKYLRLERADGGPALQVSSVVAELVMPIERVEPHWFTAVTKPAPAQQKKEAPPGIEFDSERQAPVSYGRIKFGTDNVSVHAQLLSRAADADPWRSRWDGESYSIVTEGAHRESAPVELGLTTDRYWELKTNDLSQLTAARPSLELGYYPARLRFLAQGTGPYTLAFGSARAEPVASNSCGTLLANLTANDAAQLTATAQVGPTRELGSEDVLRPRPRSTPTRLIVLWATLFFGAVVVALMAMSLLRRLKQPK